MARQEPCSRTQALDRLAFARDQLMHAELGEPWADAAERKTSGACAVLAAIAAADALCCLGLGRRSRGQDHREALALVRSLEPDGKTLADDLDNALGVKDLVHYGVGLLKLIVIALCCERSADSSKRRTPPKPEPASAHRARRRRGLRS